MSQHYPWWPLRKGDQIVWLYNGLAVWPTIGRNMGFPDPDVAAATQLMLEMVTVMNDVDQCQVAMKAVTDWRNAVIYGPETNEIAPGSPVVTTPVRPTINGGFFEQVKRWRMQVMASKAYTEAIGEALGVIGAVKQNLNPMNAQPDFRVVTSEDYWVNFTGSMQGFDAVNVQYQRKGTAVWENIGFLTRTPGGLQISPATPGTSEMGVVRGIYVLKNEEVGNYSPLYPVTIS
ncbi:MAG TPA: hypothetical protein PKA82_10525 [Pyrinomonadaceae bacterium]|nr:hypothetical protein [Pyrinomonadaceae bacterium]